jgi:hypothetical protein
MSLGIGTLGQSSQPTAATRAQPAARDRFVPAAPAHTHASLPAVDRVELSIPSTPPAELLDQVDFAFKRALDLAAQNRELHFAVDERTNRVVVKVCDLDGNAIRTIPHSAALDVMAGAKL